jgi:hypothetical protein
MSNDVHIFLAGGDACGACTALDGTLVSEGFKAHDNCLCQTIPSDEQPDCEWSFEHVGNARDGDGAFDVVSGFEVTVTCPDGSTFGASGEFDGHGFTDLDAWGGAFDEAAEALANELCDQCPPPEPFLCC